MQIYAVFGHVNISNENQPSLIDSRTHKLSNNVSCSVKGQVHAEKFARK